MPRLDRISTTFNPNDSIPDTLTDSETFTQAGIFQNGINVSGPISTSLAHSQYVKTDGSGNLTAVSSLPYLPTSGGTISGSLTVSNNLNVIINTTCNVITTTVEFTGSDSPAFSNVMPGDACMLGPNDSNYWWQSYGLHTYSDARLKENVEDFSGGMDLVSQLRPVTYTWKEGHGDNHPDRCKAIHHGFLAQEVFHTFVEREMTKSTIPLITAG